MGKVMSNPEVKREYYENGNIKYEFYYLNGEPNSEYGPAYISYDENGNVRLEYYYLNGEILTKDELYQRLTEKQRIRLLYGKCNE
jgi:antitoxin component YwqK of YwqJK toxin-antitoxin module